MKRADFIVIGAVAVVVCVMLVLLYGVNRDSGRIVQVEVDGVLTQELSLDSDAEYEINTEYGSNLLVIRDGTANMTYADCPDGICVRHREIRRTGESIICLPHKVVVSIADRYSSDSDIDAVA